MKTLLKAIAALGGAFLLAYIIWFAVKCLIVLKELRASSVGIIGGADGPTAIYVSRKKWP